MKHADLITGTEYLVHPSNDWQRDGGYGNPQRLTLLSTNKYVSRRRYGTDTEPPLTFTDHNGQERTVPNARPKHQHDEASQSFVLMEDTKGAVVKVPTREIRAPWVTAWPLVEKYRAEREAQRLARQQREMAADEARNSANARLAALLNRDAVYPAIGSNGAGTSWNLRPADLTALLDLAEAAQS